MQDISTILRIAYFSLLSTIKIDNVLVPTYDEMVPLNAVNPIIKGAECYILILDQSEQETTGTMCNDRENASITLKVVTKYPKGSGGKKLCEEISGQIQKLVRDRSFLNNLIIIGNVCNVDRITKVTAQSITENTETNTAYTKNIIYQNRINLL